MYLNDHPFYHPFIDLWRTEATAIFRRVDEDKDHVAQIVWIGIQRVDVVLETDRVRIAP